MRWASVLAIAACGGGSTAPPDASLRPKYGDGILTPRGGTITGVAAGTGLSGGGTAGSVTLNVANTAVAAGSYSNSTITVNAQGQVTAASNGAAPVTSGGLGTNTDLAIFTGTNAVGNYGGSSPSACTAGNAVIRAIMSPSGALTLTCGSAGITNSAGANVLMKSDGTNAVASSVSDNGTTVSTAENLAITGVGTLAVAALSTLTGGFTLGADSSAGSHKITSLANGVSASDAAAFGQIASGVSAAVTGTTNTIAMFTGTNAVGNGPLTVSGSTISTADNVSIQNGTGLYVQDAATPTAVVRLVTSAGAAFIESGTSTGASAAPLTISSMNGGINYAGWDASGNMTASHNLGVSGTLSVTGGSSVAALTTNGLLTALAGLTSTAGTTSLGVTNESGVFTLSDQEVFGAAGAVSYAGLTNTGVLAYDTTGHNLVLAAQETTGTSHVQLATSNSSAATVMVDVGTVGGDITLGASGATGTVSVRSGLGGGGEFRLCDSACATFWTLGRENTSTGDFQLNGTNAHIIDVAPAAVSDSLVIGTTGSTVTGTLAVTGAITGSSTLRATTILSETQLNDHTRGTEFMDDFWTTPKSDTRWTASTGVIDLANVDANHPGIFDAKTLPSGTGLGNATAWVQAGTAAGAGNGWFAGGGITDAAWEFEPSTAPSGTNHRFVAGLIDTVGTSTPNNGIYCLGDGTNTHIQVCTAKASTRTCTATLVTMTAVHWYRCQFEVNAAGTSVLFTVTDITGAASDTKTNTTNIPNTSANVCSPGIGDIRESTTGSGDLAVDYAWFKQTFTTAR